MWPLKILLVGAIVYASIVLLAWVMQTRLLFPTSMVQAGGPLPRSAERLLFEAEGERLHGIHIPSDRPSPAAPVILGFGGNAWSADAMGAYLHELFPDADILAFHYRGYAPSTGAPGGAALIADAPLVYDLAAARLPGRPIVAAGFSVGSGVAASLAARRPLAGLILVTPFDSLERVAAGHFPWLPVRLLFRHKMPVSDWLRGSKVPVAVIAAERDTLVPAERTDSLRRGIANLVFDRTVPDADHNLLYDMPEFRRAMVEALERIKSSPD